MHKKILKSLNTKLELYKRISRLPDNAETNSSKYSASVQYKMLEEDLKRIEERYGTNYHLNRLLIHARKANADTRGIYKPYHIESGSMDLKIHRALQRGQETNKKYIIVDKKRFKV